MPKTGIVRARTTTRQRNGQRATMLSLLCSACAYALYVYIMSMNIALLYTPTHRGSNKDLPTLNVCKNPLARSLHIVCGIDAWYGRYATRWLSRVRYNERASFEVQIQLPNYISCQLRVYHERTLSIVLFPIFLC